MEEYFNFMIIYHLLNKNAENYAFFDKNGRKITSKSDKIDNEFRARIKR